MRRVTCCLSAMGLALVSTGCIAAVGNRDMAQVPGKQAVALDGEIYVVNLEDNTVCKVDRYAQGTADHLEEQ